MSLADSPQVNHERQRAVRALLMHPILRAKSSYAQEFSWLRAHLPWIRDWFGKNLGWTLQMNSEFARLGKTPAEPISDSRPARDSVRGIPFTRGRYVLFCLALACLEKSESQTTLGNLANELLSTVSEDEFFEKAGIYFDLTNRESRKDLVHVILLLIDFGVLIRVDGEESQYVADTGDVLYTVYRPAISWILNVQRGPSSMPNLEKTNRIPSLLEEPRPDTEDGWNRYLRTQLSRKLIDNPVLYYSNLTPDEKAYLDRQRPFILKNLEEGTGLLGEVRAEGIALVDEEGELTDYLLPSEGTEGHFTLLMAAYISQRIKEMGPVSEVITLPILSNELESASRSFQKEYGRYWRRDAREPGAEKLLLRTALYSLEALSLIRILPDKTVLSLPAIARYSFEFKVSKEKKNHEDVLS